MWGNRVKAGNCNLAYSELATLSDIGKNATGMHSAVSDIRHYEVKAV